MKPLTQPRKTALAKHTFIALALLLALCLSSCGRKKSETILLDSGWTWALNDVSSDFIHIDTKRIYSIVDFVPNGRGYIWLKNSFELPLPLRYESLGLMVGRLNIAATVFVNGTEIGTYGQFPPNEFAPGTGTTAFRIPRQALNNEGPNEVLIRLWVDGKGGVQDLPRIGLWAEIDSAARKHSFLHADINLLFEAIILCVAIFYVFIYLRRRSEREYLYYGLMNFATAFYIFPYAISSVPWVVGFMPYLLFQKIFLAALAFVVGYFATSFVRENLYRKDTRQIKALRICMVIVPIIDLFFIPDLRTFAVVLPVLFIFMFLQLLFAVVPLSVDLFGMKKHAWRLFAGFSPATLAVAVDLFVHVIFKRVEAPLFTIWGWQATTVSFLLLLADRFAKARNNAESLAANLENEVAVRTKALTEANERLEMEHEQAAREMELAVHVQRSLYPNDVLIENGWDLAVYFKPFAGISGDLYDFYVFEDNRFTGLSLFDVSGHGIAAGLVTMLSKNVIHRAFRGGTGAPLPEVMTSINEGIIRAKGSIENYLTGIITRLEDNATGHMALVNAGSPPPFLYKKKTNDAMALVPDRTKAQCGMIGINGLEVHFQQLDFFMEEGDTLVLYTDGITEGKNPFGADYGQDRFLESFSRCGDGSASSKLANLLRDFTRFTSDIPQKDDITLIVLKRLKYVEPAEGGITAETAADYADIEELEELEEPEELEELEEIEEDEKSEALKELIAGGGILGAELAGILPPKQKKAAKNTKDKTGGN